MTNSANPLFVDPLFFILNPEPKTMRQLAMTDRVNTLTVILEHPMRTDDAEYLAQIINTIRHVQAVKLGHVDADFAVRSQVAREFKEKMRNILTDF